MNCSSVLIYFVCLRQWNTFSVESYKLEIYSVILEEIESQSSHGFPVSLGYSISPGGFMELPWGVKTMSLLLSIHAAISWDFQNADLWPSGTKPCTCCWTNPYLGFPDGTSGKESPSQYRRCKRWGLNPRARKIPWRRKWKPTPEFLPGESHGQRSLEGYSPEGRKESDMTEHIHTNPHLHLLGPVRILWFLMVRNFFNEEQKWRGEEGEK